MFKKLTPYFYSKIALILSALLFCSCDSSSTSDEFNLIDDNSTMQEFSGLIIDPDFKTTVDRFIFEAEKRNISVDMNNLVIFYGETDGAYGYCSVEGNIRTIVISPSLQIASEDLLSEVIIHELGHCVLGRDHSPDPTSIMHANIIIGQPWRTEVLDELFFGS